MRTAGGGPRGAPILRAALVLAAAAAGAPLVNPTPKLSIADGLAAATRPTPVSVSDPAQCFPFSLHHSVAATDFTFPLDALDDPAAPPRPAAARRGCLAQLRCDSVVCPVPPTPDCYEDGGTACGDGAWCQLEGHVKFGPDAVTARGDTPNVGMRSCEFYRRHARDYPYIFNTICDSKPHWGPWTATRGRCARYRTEQQSCTATLAPDASPYGPAYHASPRDGAPPVRALVCAPGLACTGGDGGPLPHTCVKRRPRDVCYQGPWWDSSWCPRVVHGAAGAGGLPLPDLLAAAAGVLASAPVEVYGSPANPRFWDAPRAVDARARAAAWLEALWPDRYRRVTQFPLRLPSPSGPPGSREFNASVAPTVTIARQVGRVWAAVHTCIHNAPLALRPDQVAASRAAAVWLRQHVSCCNCRGFFAALLDAEGLPPASSDREAHARWWWRTHNAVAEHAASTRGGHPWSWPHATDAEFAAQHAGLSDRLRCQNPWFLPWEDAVAMWTLPAQEGLEGRDEL